MLDWRALATAAYAEMLSGRSESKYDEEAEIKNSESKAEGIKEFDWRMACKVHNIVEGLEQEYASWMKTKDVRSENMFQRRGIWSSDGARNAYLYWEDLRKGTEKKVKLKRRASLQQLSRESFVAALKENEPAIHFSCSDKYENGE
eukprot:4873013-Amphidinium_carterae.2